MNSSPLSFDDVRIPAPKRPFPFRHCWLAFFAFLGLVGCHPWSLFRGGNPSDQTDYLAWQEESLPDDLDSDEWSDEFSAEARPTRPVASRQRSSPARAVPTTDDANTPASSSVPPDQKLVSNGTNPTGNDTDPTSNKPDPTSAEFVISDLTDVELEKTATIKSPKPTSPPAAQTATAPPPVESTIAEDDEGLVEAIDTELFAELSDQLAMEAGAAVTASHTAEPSRLPTVEPVDFAMSFEELVPPMERPPRLVAPATEEEGGFFRNIFIDRPGSASGPSRPEGSKDYSRIRRMFHHPEASTQYRSQSQFSRPFQRQPKDD